MMKALPLLLLMVLLAACTSGRRSYRSGDYYQAVAQATERLQRNPDHRKSRETLRQAYPMAVRFYLSEIANAQNANDPFKSGVAFENYQTLNQLYELISRSPGALAVVPHPERYFDQLNQYRARAAAERYAAGEQAERLGHRPGYIEAFEHFRVAHQYDPGYRDVRTRLEQARELATLKILVEQPVVPTSAYQLSAGFFQDRVDQLLLNYRGNELVRFYAPSDRLTQPDQIIHISFDDFVVGQTNNFRDSRQVSRDSVVVGQVAGADGKKQNVLGTVKADLVTFRQEISSRGLVSLRILDGRTRQVLAHDKLPGEFVWVSRWAEYQGDERALNDEQRALLAARPLPPPSPQQMFVEFCKPIYGQLENRVRTYFAQL